MSKKPTIRSFKGGSEYFTDVRESLRYWPYTIHQIDDTLDIGLIEGRGKQLLFRAIHSRNLMAFVGSGLSMSYGRLTWNKWAQEQKRTVEQNAQAYIALADAALAWMEILTVLVDPKTPKKTKGSKLARDLMPLWEQIHSKSKPLLRQDQRHNIWRWLGSKSRAIQAAKWQIARLQGTFDLTQDENGTFPGGDDMPIKLEIAQQLQEALVRNITLFISDDHEDEHTNSHYSWPGARFYDRTEAPADALRRFRDKVARKKSVSIPDLDREVFQACFKSYKTYRNALKRLKLINGRPEAKLGFEDLAKALLVDECPHAMILLREGLLRGKDENDVSDREKKRLNGLTRSLDIFNNDNQKRDIKGIRELPERYRILTPFKLDRFDQLREAVENKPGWGPFWRTISERLEIYLSDKKEGPDRRIYLTPSSRFLVSVALSLLADPFSTLNIGSDGKPKRPADAEKDFFQEPPLTDGFLSRRSIIASRFDPMPKIHQDLKITNFITTNYDFEIERYFQDNGFRRFLKSDQPQPDKVDDMMSVARRDNIGRVLRDQTFDPQKASELTGFALGAMHSGSRTGVYHLHGRAAKEDRMVITERDYMELYLREDENRPTIDEAIQTAFSGGPLLFLGLGMDETDLLRPLRQFISNRDRTIGYTSIALLPAEKPLAARTKAAAGLYLRYGVHTIFYGSGQISYLDHVEDIPDQDENYRLRKFGLDWLHRIMSLIAAMDSELDLWTGAKPKANHKRHVKDIAEHIKVALGTIGPDLAQGDAYPADTNVLCVLLNIPNNTDNMQLVRITRQAGEKKTNKETTAEKKADEEKTPTRGNIQTCEFTPTRPGMARFGPHQKEASVSVDGQVYLGFYTALLSDLLRMVFDLPDQLVEKLPTSQRPWTLKDEDVREATIAPIRLALNGLRGAFMTGSLNAALDGIQKEQKVWWKNWQESPPFRLAEPQRVLGGERSGEDGGSIEDWVELGTTFIRHRIDNVITPMERAKANPVIDRSKLIEEIDGKPNRLSAQYRTYIRAFDTFVAAVADTFEHRKPIIGPPEREPKLLEQERRQLITVAARRGMGKGTFMSAFNSPLGKATYKSAAWPDDTVFFAGSMYFNLGFSPEVASTYDMLASGLISVTAALETDACLPPKPDETEQGYAFQIRLTERSIAFQKSGISRLKTRLRKIHRRPDTYLRTYKILAQRLSFLESRLAHRKAGLNFLIKRQAYWNERRKKQSKRREELRAEFLRLSRHAGIKDLFEKFQAASSDYAEKTFRYPRILLNLTAVDLLYDQFVRPKNGEIDRLIALFFGPDLADCPVDFVFVADDSRLGLPWALTRGQTLLTRRLLDRKGLPLLANEQIQKSQIGSHLVLDETPEDRERRLAEPRSKRRRLIENSHFIHFTRPVNIVWLQVDNFQILATAMYLLNPPEVEDEGDRALIKAQIFKAKKRFGRAVACGLKKANAQMSDIWSKPLPPKPDAIAEARHTVRTFVRRLVAKNVKTVSEISGQTPKGDSFENALRARLRTQNSLEHSAQWRQVRRGLGNSRFALTILLAAAENLIIRQGGTMEAAREAEYLIRDTAVRVRNVGHERRDQMVLEIVLDFYRSLHAIGDPDLDCELHMLILRHLGVIGTPLASAVLIRLTEFREYFTRIGIETEVSRRRFIVRALNTMAYRGLIFRLDPHPRLVYLDTKDADWPAERDHRFALHRVVQSYALRHLNAGPNEPLHYNRFAPTLYAAMPSAGPRLSRSSYRFLRSLLIGLSQYPDIPANDQSAEPWLFTTKDTAVKVQAVRAALTMVRSNFSVAVVSRLGDADALSTGVQTRGNLETYRVRLRWIIRMAWELFEHKDDGHPDRSSDPTAIHNQVNVLYRDEIVWIYNELGVISLAQGSLSDALGYFRQAAEENERIEGLSRTAPIYNHIDLNHAIVQMERGNFQSARTRLERVLAATHDAKWRLYHMAAGYLCVLDHLSGRREGLRGRYQDVCGFFQEHQEDRASAIMLMHFSRFVVDEAPEEAVRLAQLARDLAQTSGHEDVRQHVELSAVRLRVQHADTGDVSANDLKTITEVEKFGKRMAIWSLQVDALWLRARILLKQNETATAGRLLTRAMAIARRHSMTLRLNTCLTTYAEVLIGRRDFDGALSMANQSLDLAKHIGYSIETARSQNVISECLDNTSN